MNGILHSFHRCCTGKRGLDSRTRSTSVCTTLRSFWYNIARHKLVCLIGDNCSVNTLLDLLALMNVTLSSLVGCCAHRLNLAVEADNLRKRVDVIWKLMSKLSKVTSRSNVFCSTYRILFGFSDACESDFGAWLLSFFFYHSSVFIESFWSPSICSFFHNSWISLDVFFFLASWLQLYEMLFVNGNQTLFVWTNTSKKKTFENLLTEPEL